MQHLDPSKATPEQWAVSLKQIVEKLARFNTRSVSSELTPVVSAALLIEKYPLAKDFLIRRGLSARDVEAMPMSQVVLMAAIRQFNEIRDDSFKWMYLPYPEAMAGMKKAQAKEMEFYHGGQEILPFASLLLPAVSATKTAEARTEREIAVLRVFEAMRLYAAAHDGQLPERLSDITDVPVPLDPMLGAVFTYNRLEGDMAILEAPAPNGLPVDGYWLRYEIHLESKGK